ncbi:hypothetical protein [Streptomyces sp. NPDC056160]|uniref:hypothetical protein n=1 Tax=Streptomyces sp. NPDC056160 TaxID=3345731 RepID=UPI0035E34042
MTLRIKRAATGLLLAATATVGVTVAAAGTASAAPAATLQNTLAGYTNSWQACYAAQYNNNYANYGNGSGSANEYFYCAQGDGVVNLWWRHYV